MILDLIPWTIVGLLVLAGCLYQIAAVRLVRRFAAAPPPVPSVRPPVSLLKPLCGAEPGLAEALLSCVRQDYPAFQVVFGVTDPADSALAVVRDLPSERQGVEVVTVEHAPGPARNLKVGNLINMAPAARHDLIVVADSDVRVGPRYLDDLVAPLADPAVGAVTCLYVGHPTRGLWSRLGAQGINHGFLPSALVARAVGRRDGCFGATIALRRAVLEQGGGFEALSDLLADDWALGAMARRQGLEIALAARPVDIVVDEPDLKSLFAHEVRWARTIAAIDRVGHLASVVTQPVAVAAIAAVLSAGAAPALGLLALAVACRTWAVRATARALALPPPRPDEMVLREILTFVVYAVASLGRTVLWRGRRFVVRRDGTLEPVEGLA